MIEALPAIEGILSDLASLASAASTPPGKPAVAAAPPSAASFSEIFRALIDGVDGNVASATQAAHKFAAGADDIPLSDVMVGLEKASLGLQLAANVRDKIVAAYTNVMNMPV
jgi:flagellar hook-basal body complex protein FliE